MSLRFSPRTDAERAEVSSALERYGISSDADAAFVALDTRYFSTARADYSAALESHQRWTAIAREASDAADSADLDFDRDLRLFTASVRDDSGHAATEEITELLGGIKPSALSRLPYTDEVAKATRLLVGLSERSTLSYDAACADALRTSTAALATAAAADKEATRKKVSAGATLAAARSTFDQSYAKLVRAARALFAEEVVCAVLPRFVRSDGAARKPEEVAGAPSA